MCSEVAPCPVCGADYGDGPPDCPVCGDLPCADMPEFPIQPPSCPFLVAGEGKCDCAFCSEVFPW